MIAFARPTAWRSLTLGALSLTLALSQAVAARQAGKTVNDGVYTAAQAERGEKVFAETCTACHDAERFTGAEFVGNWQGQPLQALFAMVNTMPEDNPGSLKPEQYADVLAYFLKLNDYPAGKTDLPSGADALKGIGMVARK
jgi:mono/diheme cytochrome c family protein